jgi:hypothetical protein
VTTRQWMPMLLAAGLLFTVAACSSDDEVSGAEGSASPGSPSSAPAESSPAAPSLEEQQIEWAGRVCISRDRLTEQVTSLGQNLEFDLGLDASVLDQLDRQLRLQVLRVGSAANDLGTVLVTAPVDPADANDWLLSFTKAQEELQSAVDTTTGHLDAMTSADGLADGLSEGLAAVSAGVAAFEAGKALVSTAQDTYVQAREEFAPAFAAAPQCQSDALAPGA